MTPERLAQLAREASEEFDELRTHRFKLGEEKYGAGKWMTVDTLEEALFELADLSNYAMFTFVRIRILQARLSEINDAAISEDFSKDLED